MKKKLLVIILAVVMLLCLVACNTNDDPTHVVSTKLDTPINVKISSAGLITWSAVEHATSYVVKINTTEHAVNETQYQVENITASFRYSVKAVGEGCEDSDYSAIKTYKYNPTPVGPTADVNIGISGKSEIKSGSTITLTANVTGAETQTVSWKITSGSEYATINDNGVVTASEVTKDATIVVEASIVVDKNTVKAQKVINVLSKPALTQAMLDVFDNVETIGFEGYVGINLYVYDPVASASGKGALYSTYATAVKTAMDGTNWYAEYENSSTGTTTSLYCKNHNGKASEVGLSFYNDEEYFDITDDNDNYITWEDSGFYNSLGGLSVSDFTFDEESWRWVYSGNNSGLADKILASANPYDFTPKGFALIIGDGEILGIYSMAEDDYSIADGYIAVQELFVAVNIGEQQVGEVKTIAKYSHEEIHNELATAIENMHNLSSYTLTFTQYSASYLTSGTVVEGFDETITADDCYFRPFTLTTKNNETTKVYSEGEEYGFHKFSENLYNSFYYDGENFVASRAYATTFDHAKPTLGFSAEIFRSYYIDEEEGTISYYVEELMNQVATTYYYGVGNDIALYGIFANTTLSTLKPYVVVKDGYIVESGFYYYLGYLYGVITINYSDFNTATLPDGINVSFETHQVPTSWNQLEIQVSNNEKSTDDDVATNANEYLHTYLGTEVTSTINEDGVISWEAVDGATKYEVKYNNETVVVTGVTQFDTQLTKAEVTSYSVVYYILDVEDVPFLVNVLGDTYGFGLTTVRLPSGGNVAISMLGFYYDVPLDIDYTITTSLDAIADYLLELGFTKGANDVYTKGNICVNPVDSSLDLMVYVWKTNS